jgi:hypothetical protein
MGSTDRFLVAIVVAALALVAVAFALALRRPPPDYTDTSTPAGVALAYIQAFQNGDLSRALSYIDPMVPGYPSTVERLDKDAAEDPWTFGRHSPSASYQIVSTDVAGDLATVTVNATTFQEGGLFGSSEYTEQFRLTLRRGPDGWRVSRGDRFWYGCWDNPAECEKYRPGYARPIPLTAPTVAPAGAPGSATP